MLTAPGAAGGRSAAAPVAVLSAAETVLIVATVCVGVVEGAMLPALNVFIGALGVGGSCHRNLEHLDLRFS